MQVQAQTTQQVPTAAQAEAAYLQACARNRIRDAGELADITQKVSFWYRLNDEARLTTMERMTGTPFHG